MLFIFIRTETSGHCNHAYAHTHSCTTHTSRTLGESQRVELRNILLLVDEGQQVGHVLALSGEQRVSGGQRGLATAHGGRQVLGVSARCTGTATHIVDAGAGACVGTINTDAGAGRRGRSHARHVSCYTGTCIMVVNTEKVVTCTMTKKCCSHGCNSILACSGLWNSRHR